MIYKMSETNINAMNGNSNSNSNTNSNTEKKRYELVSKESIALIAEQNGLADVSEDAILMISSDVSYRIRELFHNSIEFMRHSKRRRLTTADVNRALEASDCGHIFGFEANDSTIDCVYVKDADVFVRDDPIVDLNEEMNKIFDKKSCDIKVFEKRIDLSVDWISVDSKLQPNEDNCVNGVECSEELKDYYQTVVKAILGTDNQSFVTALKDLSTNSRISPVMPFLINFIMNGIRRLSHDISQLKRFLNTIECLFRNPSLFLATDPYLNVLLQSILECIVEPLNPISDHWTLRDSASHLLVNVLNEWFTPFVGNRLLIQTITSLRKCLLDFSKPFSSHYGAIKAFQSLGFDIIVEHLYPILSQYFTHLLPAINSNHYSTDPQTRTDGFKVLAELLFIAELISLKFRSILNNNFETKIDFNVYNELSNIFGDSLSARLPIDFQRFRFRYYAEKRKNCPKSTTNLFETPESMQTGEQLLDAFYEAPTHTDELRSEMSGYLEDDNSCDENSVLSDAEKAPTDMLQIKSSISDPTLGIKLTFKKLRTDHSQTQLGIRRSGSNKKSIAVSCEPVFETICLKQTLIRFSGFSNRLVAERGPKRVAPTDPSKWFAATMTNPNHYCLRRNCKIGKNDKHFSLYSCDLLNVI